MSRHTLTNQPPTQEEVRAALEHIVLSQSFRSSPQLASFLTFVVEAVLHGKSDRIKGYTIGVEVLRRDTRFDPQLDPIVRVEATRLRRALERYYAGPGINEAVIIDLPRGSYVPTFTRRSEILDDPDKIKVSRLTKGRSVWISVGSALVTLAAILTWVLIANRGEAPVQSAQKRSENILPGNGMPTIVVHNFEIVGTPDQNAPSATALLEKLRDTLSRFDAINIATQASSVGRAADYQLYGFIEYLDGGITSVRFRLRDVRDGNVAWTRSFDRLPNARGRSQIEDSIAAEVATALLQPFGFIRSRERTRFLANGPGDPRYACLLLASDAFRSFNPEDHADARKCLQRQIEIHPGFGPGYSYLAVVYNREWTYGFGQAADDSTALDVALKLAQRGVELSPDDARAWQILSSVFFSRHDTPAAIAASQKAVVLNPNDVIIVTDYGGRLITIGEVERGMTMLENNPINGGIRPSWQNFYLFLGNYMRGKIPEATREADEMTSDTYSLGLFAHAFMAAVNGNKKKAQLNWNKLVALRGTWRDNPRAELERYIPSPVILDRLMRDLASSGLYPPQ